MTWINSRLDRLAGRGRLRIEIGPHPHATQAIDARKTDFHWLEVLLGQWQQMRAFFDHRRADGLGMSGDLTPLVFMTGGQQLGVEIIKIPCVWQRYPVIAPEVAGFAFNPAFFVRFPRVAKVTREAPVRAEGDEARGLLAPMALQNL